MVTMVTTFFAFVVSRYARQQLFSYIWLPPLQLILTRVRASKTVQCRGVCAEGPIMVDDDSSSECQLGNTTVN